MCMTMTMTMTNAVPHLWPPPEQQGREQPADHGGVDGVGRRWQQQPQ